MNSALQQFINDLNGDFEPKIVDIKSFNEPEWLRRAEQLWETKQEIKELTRYGEEILDDLKHLSNGQSQEHGDFILTVSHSASTDYKQACLDARLDLEPYKKEPSERWTVKKKELRNKQIVIR